MELLRAAVPSIPEFTSLSIVFRPGDVYNDLSMADPMILPSPLSSISASLARSALQELHASVTATLRRAPDGAHATTAESSHVVAETFKDDLKLLDDLQVFRPLATYGLGVVYKFIRGDAAAALTAKLAGVLLAAHKSNAQAEPLKTADEDILGILLCVGVSGMAVSSVTSLTHYQLSERLNACRDILNSMGPTTVDVSAVKTLLSTLLLLEDDARLTNGRADAVLLTSIPEIDEAHEKKGGLMSPLVGRRASVTKQTAADQADKEQVPLTLTLNSSDMVRTVAENMKVLSVAETDSILRKYAVSGLERKATLDLLGGGSTSSSKSSRFSRKRLGGRDADLDQFDYKGPFKETIQSSGVATVPLQGASQGHQPQQSQGGSSLPVPRKDTKGKTAPALSAPKGDHTTGRRGKGQFTDDESSQQQQQAGGAFDPFGQRPRGRRQKFEDDNDTVGSTARLQVNIALNEDLSCSYRSSQLSSCTVEGVVQVQVKSSSKTTVPFFLLMKDPARHVESFVQNKKFADDVSASLMAEEDADRKFTVSVPKDDSYFPVVRYKCTDELRPVPMRVQTRVKLDDTYCRVALQISSNPNNEAKLVDLTIIMGIPEDVLGESLATQPAGGVWNSGKRCVTWCVEELGEGEKFQLQARFTIDKNGKYDPSGEKPAFPVLVRCQCLFAQLSDVELEVRDIPDVAPADVTMKIARRFRLSHRERS